MNRENIEKLKKEFLDMLIKKGALRIAGSINSLIVLKSGRKTTYFANFGELNDGESASGLKKAYATFIHSLLQEKKIEDFDFIFGPAYKGINLACLACEGLHEIFGINKKYMYDRKEEKGHGDMSAENVIVGAGSFRKGQKILMIDDVITTGKAKLDALEKIRLLGEHKIVGIVIAIDRQDKTGDAENVGMYSAVEEMEKTYGIKVHSFLRMQDIFDIVKQGLSPDIKQAWIDYYDKYGVVKLRD